MNSHSKRGFIYLTLTIMLFSTYEVVSRTLVGKIDPAQVNFIRFLFGGIILSPLALLEIKKSQTKLTGKDLVQMALLGFLLVGISMNLLQYGINETQANISAAIFSFNPIFVALVAAILLREPLGLKKILGLCVGFAGVAIIFFSYDNGGQLYLHGLIYLVLAALAFGIYTVLGKKFTLKFGSITMNAVTFLFGSLLFIPFLLWRGIPLFSISLDIIPQIAYLSVFVTGLAYYSYFKGLGLTDTSLGSMVFFVKPPLACLLAALTLGEQLTWGFALGTLIILTSIYALQEKPKKATSPRYLTKEKTQPKGKHEACREVI
ncbi:MAG: DMT family transporter [Desulfitobacterium sp.]|nr:DMT family transporter [Desulfitobacterium sp.]